MPFAIVRSHSIPFVAEDAMNRVSTILVYCLCYWVPFVAIRVWRRDSSRLYWLDWGQNTNVEQTTTADQRTLTKPHPTVETRFIASTGKEYTCGLVVCVNTVGANGYTWQHPGPFVIVRCHSIPFVAEDAMNRVLTMLV